MPTLGERTWAAATGKDIQTRNVRAGVPQEPKKGQPWLVAGLFSAGQVVENLDKCVFYSQDEEVFPEKMP